MILFNLEFLATTIKRNYKNPDANKRFGKITDKQKEVANGNLFLLCVKIVLVMDFVHLARLLDLHQFQTEELPIAILVHPQVPIEHQIMR